MPYILGQYNKNKTVADDNIFMTLIPNGTNRRKAAASDSETSGSSNPFVNECCYISSGLAASRNYYFHGRIKRMLSTQTIYIKLINYEDDTQTDNVEQYIKTINIAAGDVHEWVDIEFVFTPLIVFNTILFELKRDVSDYREEIRYPIIAYQELSQVENLITARIGTGIELIKVGIQSHPGLMMCINGEEIHTPRSGIYELKNGIMLVSFFSIVSPAKEEETTLTDWMNTVNDEVDEIERRRAAGEITDEEAEALKAAINSRCFFATSKKRIIDSFTMDYMYREE